MCGICGVVSFEPNVPLDRSLLQRMNNSIRHRGPDDEGYYQDEQASLAMRRLSIIDLHTGQQPISNETGDVWVVYNGEIYNFKDVRTTLQQRGHTFKTQTDTEVIVHAYEEYGDNCVEHFNGMFAIALWDTRKRRLFLARDRVGIKPLYYWAGLDKLVFASELKALVLHPDVPRQLNLVAFLKLMVDKLKLQLLARIRSQFGASSEQLQDPQIALIEGAPLDEQAAAKERAKLPAANTTQIDRTLPAHLPRETRHYHPETSASHSDSAGQPCGCTACGGRLRRIGQDVSEQLEYVTSHFKVIRHARPKLACVSCQTIFQAEARAGRSRAAWQARGSSRT
jgi:asparagine synthetase B (glutamine-hydrolysing)